MTYFEREAKTLVEHIIAGVLSRKDVAACLQCVYSAGVVDGDAYTVEEKTVMRANIMKIYHLKEEDL